MAKANSKAIEPAQLRPHYRAFLRPERILLTGHSHQAWPDVARGGVIRAFDAAAAHVDDKWSAASAEAELLRETLAAFLGGAPRQYALAPNTHELGVRFLSALDWRRRRHVVTTDGEFHSIRRQLDRLEEEGLEITRVVVTPLETLAERLAAALRPDTAAAMVSTVLFQTAAVVPHLEALCERARVLGVRVLLDAYHHVGALPWRRLDPEAFVVGGGYKYLQWGEGCCFLRVPEDDALRPIYTGWFSDFAHLSGRQTTVRYGTRPAERFAGSTYDPVSHFRAGAVVRFFRDQGLTIEGLRACSLRQTARIRSRLESFEIASPARDDARGGFVAARVPGAGSFVTGLRKRGIFADARGELLRFGPAPYTTDDEIDEACAALRTLASP